MEKTLSPFSPKTTMILDSFYWTPHTPNKPITDSHPTHTRVCHPPEEFHGIVMSLEKVLQDGRQLVKGGSMLLTEYQMQLPVGIRPSVADCIEGLRTLHEMHNDDAQDLSTFQRLLVDQPNIPKQEVQSIFAIIFADSG
ncbi:hypothetical protein Syun_025393 [Stephania yunnanensis]|uniref:Uncharacterized protein n=1 Tax=Stephania yunnanensis TaxID=152371 RepID=A0AAP0EYR0_9MAGN